MRYRGLGERSHVEEQDDGRAGLELAHKLRKDDRNMIPNLVKEDAKARCIRDLLTTKSLCQNEISERVVGEEMAWQQPILGLCSPLLLLFTIC